jgi:NAD(P)-dependent dehydrogenase (short-subunit alcohol dehydrogenase family)
MVEQRPRVAVVTGASSGIGLVTAKALAAQGWTVIGHGRDPQRSQIAEDQIRSAAAPSARVEMLRADISRMSEVARLAEEIGGLTDRIDVLVNNAGGTSNAQRMTEEGNEATFAANHLGPFLLTRMLMPLLHAADRDASPGETRIINVSSSAHETSNGLDWTDLQSFENFVPILAYCNAKLANILFTRSLARRLAGTGIVAHSVHPGAVDTNFYSHADVGTQEFARTNGLIGADAGADTLVWLATAPEPGDSTAGYYHERKRIIESDAARDDAAAERLWAESEMLVKTNLERASGRQSGQA